MIVKITLCHKVCFYRYFSHLVFRHFEFVMELGDGIITDFNQLNPCIADGPSNTHAIPLLGKRFGFIQNLIGRNGYDRDSLGGAIGCMNLGMGGQHGGKLFYIGG